ncbi:unnamed protein product [Onchocerca ochengi]|uniref:Cystatin domain-containing protein n=1 Tax=Onchocerca ochengi TaxID=42157 RepID=A0A182E8P3_ONCOC|nr:unnamed protein product [Onchocerca ochengi]
MLRLIVLFAIFVSFSNGQYENDSDVKDVIEDSLLMINAKMKSKFLYKLEKIVKAHVLVVESTIYDLILRLAPTSCKMKGLKRSSIGKCKRNMKQKPKDVALRISESMTGKLTVELKK